MLFFVIRNNSMQNIMLYKIAVQNDFQNQKHAVAAIKMQKKTETLVISVMLIKTY